MLLELEGRGARNTARAMPVVQRIVAGVRKGGDRALRRYAARLDGLAPQQPLEISRAEMEQAWAATPKAVTDRHADGCWKYPPIRRAANAKTVEHDHRRAHHRATGAGARCGRVLCAQRALSPAFYLSHDGDPGTGGRGGANRGGVAKPAKETLAAAALLGVSAFYRIGGAQAVAALAFGTQSIPRVDKIVGPGNWYVTAAKKMVAFDCAIDMLAGPTEIVVTSETATRWESRRTWSLKPSTILKRWRSCHHQRASCARGGCRGGRRVKTNPIARQAIERNGWQ